MSHSTPSDTNYLLEHYNEHEEVRRLEGQAQFLNGLTRRLFEIAGIGRGMRVLDVGSGAGDVSLLLAEYVGREGRIVGVELNPEMVHLARLRVQAAGLSTISFLEGDISTVALEGQFDAIVGRLILVYLQDSLAALRHVIEHLRPGGIVAFQEIEHGGMGLAWPPAPLFSQAGNWIRETFRRSGLELHMGLHLYRLFLDAGLPGPEMELITTAGGDPAWEGYYQLATVVGILLPVLLKLGVATEEEVGIETLEQRLREEAAQRRGTVTALGLMSAWTRKAQ